MKKTLYIAGPYTQGLTSLNVNRAMHAAEAAQLKGYAVFLPHLYHYWNDLYPHGWDFWMEMSKAWLLRSNALLRIPGESRGADLEVKLAYKRKIPVYFSLDDLPDTKKAGN